MVATWEITPGFDSIAAIERFTQRQVAGKPSLGPVVAHQSHLLVSGIFRSSVYSRDSAMFCARRKEVGDGVSTEFSNRSEIMGGSNKGVCL
jgi:hypothetical protein